jgi:hypothetical protein
VRALTIDGHAHTSAAYSLRYKAEPGGL